MIYSILGNIVSVRIPTNVTTNKQRGFGYVQFSKKTLDFNFNYSLIKQFFRLLQKKHVLWNQGPSTASRTGFKSDGIFC